MPQGTGGILSYWPIEPMVLLGVELAAVLYIAGGISHRRNRGAHAYASSSGSSTGRWRSVAFWSGLAVILLALQSPIEILARQLFWVHMVQHLLLLAVAAPLLALSSPWTRMWRALPLVWRRNIARPLFRDRRFQPVRSAFNLISRPGVIWVLTTGNLWLWHLPALYDVTLRYHLVHHLEHGIFLGLGLAFWTQVIDQVPFHARLGSLARASYVFLAMVASWGLAALLSFATSPFYAYSLLQSRPGGISALTDQQLGGGMMWVPGAIPYSIAFIALLFRWLAEEDARPHLMPTEMDIGGTSGG
jgi:putative membrane protein